jgi:hypothetical protein
VVDDGVGRREGGREAARLDDGSTTLLDSLHEVILTRNIEKGSQKRVQGYGGGALTHWSSWRASAMGLPPTVAWERSGN